MDSTLQAQLVAAGVRVAADDVVTPADAAGVAAALRVLSSSATRCVISSGDGSHTGAVTLSLAALRSLTVQPQSLTLRAEAGASLSAVRAAGAQERLAVVGLGSEPRSERVGSLIARGEVPRRALCGVEAVLASGELVQFGGGVLKDVVGYDLPALLLGSMGRLAAVVAVTFRLEPESARTPVGAAPGRTDHGLGVLLTAFDPQGLLQQAG